MKGPFYPSPFLRVRDLLSTPSLKTDGDIIAGIFLDSVFKGGVNILFYSVQCYHCGDEIYHNFNFGLQCFIYLSF